MRRRRKPVPAGKRRYLVVAEVTISMNTEVIASSEEEARELAGQHGMLSLCHQCASGDATTEWVTSGEFDGEPDKIIEVTLLDESPSEQP